MKKQAKKVIRLQSMALKKWARRFNRNNLSNLSVYREPKYPADASELEPLDNQIEDNIMFWRAANKNFKGSNVDIILDIIREGNHNKIAGYVRKLKAIPDEVDEKGDIRGLTMEARLHLMAMAIPNYRDTLEVLKISEFHPASYRNSTIRRFKNGPGRGLTKPVFFISDKEEKDAETLRSLQC